MYAPTNTRKRKYQCKTVATGSTCGPHAAPHIVPCTHGAFLIIQNPRKRRTMARLRVLSTPIIYATPIHRPSKRRYSQITMRHAGDDTHMDIHAGEQIVLYKRPRIRRRCVRRRARVNMIHMMQEHTWCTIMYFLGPHDALNLRLVCLKLYAIATCV